MKIEEDSEGTSRTDGTLPAATYAPWSAKTSTEPTAAIKTANNIQLYDKRADNEYWSDCKAPYVTYIERIDIDIQSDKKNTSVVYFVYFGVLRKIASKFVDLEYDLKRIEEAKFKISILFEEYKNANSFVKFFRDKLGEIPEENWIIYVPDYKVVKKVVIRGFKDGSNPANILQGI